MMCDNSVSVFHASIVLLKQTSVYLHLIIFLILAPVPEVIL